ncbi:hypothetical protein HYC85_003324 [Camellia sinensis]|uniref:Uncharacterized protein n=1 Tax=Camellia sinensis TaxID=4442 RepID=A0A7J7IB71_CAMSI|nr:hypothetical protein HYC85_003324 [Camellia sinensis]
MNVKKKQKKKKKRGEGAASAEEEKRRGAASAHKLRLILQLFESKPKNSLNPKPG